ncbi:MAG TPA: hypothetical protein VMW16_03085 [Sedimentisphaerales bacterium]|nr:hypothetical protein [Sedimentisphaerales bacterium]
MRPESTSVVLRADLQALAQEFDAETAALRFIGRRTAPIFESAVAEGQYPIMNRENFKKPANTDRAEDGSYNRIVGQFGRGTYDCEEHGLEYPIDDRKRKRYARFFDAEKAATRILRYQMLLAHERRVAALYAAGSFTNHNVATAWTTVADAAPLDDIATGIDTICDACGCAQEQLSIIIPRVDFREMLRTAQVIDKLKYTFPGIQPALLRPAQVASMLQIKQVLIASGAYDTTEEGIAETMAMIWTAGVMYIALLCEEGEGLEEPSAARSIMWAADAPELPVVESYREDKKRADIVRMRDDTDEVLIGETDLFVYKLTNT